MGLAAAIIVGIFTGAINMLTFVGNLIGKDSKDASNNSVVETPIDADSLEMEIAYAEVYIKTGDEFKAETNSENITITQEEGKLVIEEKDHSWLGNEEGKYVTVYIPEEKVLDMVSMETGAGVVQIDTLKANYIDMELGAGKLVIENIYVEELAEIQGGAGKVEINNGYFNRLAMDMGVGESVVKANITGDSKLEVGVGKLTLQLRGIPKDYTFRVDKGLGDVIINGEKAKDGDEIGTGPFEIELVNGVGTIDVEVLDLSSSTI